MEVAPSSSDVLLDPARPRRTPIKSQRPNWKEELRSNCLKRVRRGRLQLLWKVRNNGLQSSSTEKNNAETEVRNIISDELQRMKNSSKQSESKETDILWEYDGLLMVNLAETESEDLLLEMERLLYEELREEAIRKEMEGLDEEDEYLAQAVLEHMQLNEKEKEKVYCPVCKRGELLETCNLIHCSSCKLRLDLKEDKVTLGFLKDRLAEVHLEHFDRGCKAQPVFCMQSMFGLAALYIQCQLCHTFEIVL